MRLLALNEFGNEHFGYFSELFAFLNSIIPFFHGTKELTKRIHTIKTHNNHWIINALKLFCTARKDPFCWVNLLLPLE